MSLMLSYSINEGKPLIVARTGIPWDGLNLTMGDVEMDISKKDMCCLIEYFITNTDLSDNDPRIPLIESIKKFKIVEGFNPGGNRIEYGG